MISQIKLKNINMKRYVLKIIFIAFNYYTINIVNFVRILKLYFNFYSNWVIHEPLISWY